MKYDGHSELLNAAPKRLKDAQELLQEPSLDPDRSDAEYRHLTGAYYLAGYAVECALKAYIIMLMDARGALSVTRWSEAITLAADSHVAPDLSGARGHNLERLLRAARLEGEVASDVDMQQNWGICRKWDYNERYRPAYMVNRQSVCEFVDACDASYRWIRSRLPFA